MSEVAHNTQHEFWRPPAAAGSTSALVEVCDGCSTEFMVGSRYCHVCGRGREEQAAATTPSWTRHLQFQNIKEGLGLSTPSLIAFVIGVACALGAIACGVIYSERNVLEWQAVQLYRAEWLLASIAAFVGGILLRKPASK